MKATGIVRRIDDLGRVVIPKEIRRTMRIREGDPSQTTLTQTDRFCFAILGLSKRIGLKPKDGSTQKPHSLNFYKIFDFAVEFYEELVYNGRGRYAIVDMEEFEKTQATLKLMHELAKGEASAKEKGYIDISEVEDILEVAHG